MSALLRLPRIDTDVPMPTPIRRAALNSTELQNRILSCRKGDSFFIPTTEPERLQVNALSVARRLRLNYTTRAKLRITTRSLTEGSTEGIRIWRVR